MRLRSIVLSALFLAGCRSEDYDGDSFPSVVEGYKVEIVDEVPSDARVIGFVSDSEENHIDSSTVLEEALSCDVENRLIRRMKRAAADEGGEFLVGLFCETTEGEDADSVHDDPDTSEAETPVYCETYCEAEVARRWIHERG